MFKKMCKYCFETYSGKPETCPHCGHVLRAPKDEQVVMEDASDNVTTSEDIQEQARPKKVKKERKKRLSSKEIMDGIDFIDLHKKATAERKSGRRKKDKTPEFKVDKNGEYNVDVKDVTYLPTTYTYSAKKARGEFDTPKIKWWEVYKWADLLMARRKIKKQVKKASYYRPKQFSKPKLITYSILFGWMGAHNFYARNYKKAVFMLVSLVIGSFIALAPFAWLDPVRVSLGGGFLFVNLMIWVTDIINLCTNTFSFRLSKWKFIDNLNFNTRATLGEKYIDKDEYKKPWIVRVINDIKKDINERKAKKQQKVEDQTKTSETVETDKHAEQVETVNVETKVENNLKNKKEKPKNKQNKKAKVIIKKKK